MENKQLICLPQTEILGYGFNEIQTDGEGLLLQHVLRPNQTIFDVGANAGDWTKYALQIEPSLQIACFEPVPSVYEQLKANLPGRESSLHNMALSDYEGEGDFFATEHFEYGWSSFINRPDFKSRARKIKVKVDTLDHLTETQKIEHIHFLKIDVEGGELGVLLGAERLLSEQRIHAIQFEYGGTFPDAGITLREVLLLLTNKDYKIFRIFTQGLIHISRWRNELENHTYCNYFACSKENMPQFGKMIFH